MIRFSSLRIVKGWTSWTSANISLVGKLDGVLIRINGKEGYLALMVLQILEPVVRIEAASTTITSGFLLVKLSRASFPVLTKVTLYPLASRSGTKEGMSALLFPVQSICDFDFSVIKAYLQKRSGFYQLDSCVIIS